jgi:hypothetical protein
MGRTEYIVMDLWIRLLGLYRPFRPNCFELFGVAKFPLIIPDYQLHPHPVMIQIMTDILFRTKIASKFSQNNT